MNINLISKAGALRLRRRKQSFRRAGGLFQTDENKGFWDNVWIVFSRWTWESPQTITGMGYSHLQNLMGNVDRVDYLGGATYVTDENYKGNYPGGITIGSYININNEGVITGNFVDYVLSNPIYMHEYGHTIDSRNYGLSYLFAIGIPSLDSANGSESLSGPPFSTHRGYWTEKRANYFAKKYFGKYYGVDWNMNYHPSWYPYEGEWKKDANGNRYYYYLNF